MDYNQRVRDRLTFVFADRAKFQTEYHFGKNAGVLTRVSVQLLLLLLQKVNYLTCKSIEQVKGIYDLHEYVPYEKLRTEAGRQTIDDLLTQLTEDIDGILLELTPENDVLFTIVADTPSPTLSVRDILISMDYELAQFIRNGGKGEQLTAKCEVLRSH